MSPTTWTNWARTIETTPAERAFPTTATEIAQLVRRAGETDTTIKCVGAAHSFSPCAATEGILVSLDDFAGVESVTPLYDAAGTPSGADVTVFAGTRLHQVSPVLWELGLSQENLGDFNQQSIAGAISTGTHGTGAEFGGTPTTIQALQIITGTGEILDCDAHHHPELFEAAKLGFGALGIISKITLRCVPAFALRADNRPGHLEEALSDLDAFFRSDDHVEFFWFPHTDGIFIRKNHRLPGDTELSPKGWLDQKAKEDFVNNDLFEAACKVVRKRPQLTPYLNRVSSRLMSRDQHTDRSYRIFASARRVRFKEMEYAVPAAVATDVIRELKEYLDRCECPTPFPLEVRCAKADDVMMSTANGRDVVYIAAHQYLGMEWQPYFRRAEEIFRAAGGRPHWGKMHTLGVEDLREIHPHYDAFVAIRDQVDPQRVFANVYTAQVLPE